MINECVEDSARWFPGKAQRIENQVLCLAGEVGEVANLVKKIIRGSEKFDEVEGYLAEEIVDVQIYLCNLMGNPVFANVDWEEVWRQKREYNESRFGSWQDEHQVPFTAEQRRD